MKTTSPTLTAFPVLTGGTQECTSTSESRLPLRIAEVCREASKAMVVISVVLLPSAACSDGAVIDKKLTSEKEGIFVKGEKHQTQMGSKTPSAPVTKTVTYGGYNAIDTVKHGAETALYWGSAIMVATVAGVAIVVIGLAKLAKKVFSG